MPMPRLLALATLAIVLGACHESSAPAPPDAALAAAAVALPTPAEDPLARGEYLVRIAGCNDCHTAGYAERGGEVDRAEWLTGSPLGYSGPWGTTYAANLRMRIDGMDEAEWLAYTATLRTRPIMPDFALRSMPEADRIAIYRFVKSLGPAGQPAPAFVPPGETPPPPYFQLVLPEGTAPAPVPAGAR